MNRMPNYGHAGHQRKKHTSAFLRRLRRSIQWSASSLSSEQDRFRSGGVPTVSVQQRRNDLQQQQQQQQQQHQERIVRITALPLHEDATALPATTVVENLPLTLGRRNLATWWWDACWDCHTINNNINIIDDRKSQKRRHFCVNCRPLAKEVECLSKQMMTISKEGFLEFSGKNTGTLLHIIHDKSKPHERLFDLSIGKEGEPPWMKFRIEIPQQVPQLSKSRWLTTHNKSHKSVTPSPATKANTVDDTVDKRNIAQEERPGSPLSVFSPEWCFPVTEAARKLRGNKSPPRKRPKVLVFPSLQESQQQQQQQRHKKKKQPPYDRSVQSGDDDDKSLGSSSSIPRHQYPAKKKRKRPSPLDDRIHDSGNEEGIQRQPKHNNAEFSIRRRENEATSTLAASKKVASQQRPPKRKLFDPVIEKKDNVDQSVVGTTDIHLDKDIIAPKYHGMTQGVSALSYHSDTHDMNNSGDGDNDNHGFENEGDHCRGEGQTGVFDTDLGKKSNGETDTGAMTQGVATQLLCHDPLNGDEKRQTAQSNAEYSQPDRREVDTPEVQKEVQGANAESAISNFHQQYTQQRTQMDSEIPIKQTRLYCQQDAQTGASSNSTCGGNSGATPAESQQAISLLRNNSASNSILQPDSQPRFRLPSISFQSLNLSSEGAEGGHTSTAKDAFVSQQQSQQQHLHSQGGGATDARETADNKSSSELMMASQAQVSQCPRTSWSAGYESEDDGVESQALGKTHADREMSRRDTSQEEKEEVIGTQSAISSQDSSVLDLPMCDNRFSTQSSLVVHDNMNHPSGIGCSQHHQDEGTTSAQQPRIQQLAHWKTLQQQKTGRSKSSRALIDLVVEKNQGNHSSNVAGSFWLPSILDDC